MIDDSGKNTPAVIHGMHLFGLATALPTHSLSECLGCAVFGLLCGIGLVSGLRSALASPGALWQVTCLEYAFVFQVSVGVWGGGGWGGGG